MKLWSAQTISCKDNLPIWRLFKARRVGISFKKAILTPTKRNKKFLLKYLSQQSAVSPIPLTSIMFTYIRFLLSCFHGEFNCCQEGGNSTRCRWLFFSDIKNYLQNCCGWKFIPHKHKE